MLVTDMSSLTRSLDQSFVAVKLHKDTLVIVNKVEIAWKAARCFWKLAVVVGVSWMYRLFHLSR